MKKIILIIGLIFIINISLVMADTVEFFYDAYASGGSSSFDGLGATFSAKARIELISVNKTASSTATTVDLKDSDGVFIAEATYVGVTATFSSPETLELNTVYRLEDNSGGASFNFYQKDGSTIGVPIIGTFVNFLTGSNRGINDSNAYEIVAIIVREVLPLNAPIVNLTFPTNGMINNTNLFNISYNTSAQNSIIVNASLWTNTTGTWQLNKSNSTEIINNSVNYFNDTNFPEGFFIWNVEVCDNDTNCSFASSNYTLRIDTTNPIITPEPNLTLNKTYIINGTLTTYINFSDESEIYSINVTLGNGTELFGNTNMSVSFYQLNISTIIAEGGIGNLTARVCDTHTKNLIKDIENKVKNKGIKYVMKKEFIIFDKEWVYIYPKDFANYNTPSTSKQKDRYSFTFNKETAPNIETFVVESSHYIDINKNQYYGGHLIIPGINNGYWIDFENTEATSYDIKRISNKKIEVTVYGLKNKKITFNSIGELNCVNETFYFLNLDPTEAFTSNVLVNENTTFYLNVSEHPTFNITINATLNYNDTNFNVGTTTNFSQIVTTPSTIVGNMQNISFLWILNIEGADINLTERNQTVSDFFLDNCTNSSMQTLNFSILDEDTEASIAGDITGTFNYSFNDIFKTFNLVSANRNTTQMCLFPNRTTLTDDYSLVYEATDYPQRGFSDENIILTNISVDVPLYLLHIDEGIFARFRIVDSFQRSLNGVRGEMERVVGGSTITIEVEESDDSGLMTFWLDPDVTYTFIFSLEGFTTESVDLRVTTGEIFTVTLGGGLAISNNQSFETGIISSFSPSNIILQNNTNYTFMFNMTSIYWTITDCTLFIQNGSTVLTSSSSSFDDDSCDIAISYSTANLDTIISKVVYSLNGTEISKQREYRIRFTYEGDFSLKNFMDDLKAFGQAGFNDFTRIVIAFIIITSIIASLSIKAGLREPISMTILTLGLVWFFSFLGWMTINYDSIPTEWLKQYILAILLSLIGGSYLMNEVSK